MSETRKPGRPKGAVNKATADIKALAGKHSEDAIKALVAIMEKSESDAARVAAANSILDRAHGKPKQAIDVDANVKATITEIRRTVVDPANRDTQGVRPASAAVPL